MSRLFEWPLILDFLRTPTAQAVLLVAVLLIMLVCAFYFLRRLRDQINEEHRPASDLLTNYREMHQRGVITEAEYRTIKGRLAAELQEELSELGDTDSEEES